MHHALSVWIAILVSISTGVAVSFMGVFFGLRAARQAKQAAANDQARRRVRVI